MPLDEEAVANFRSKLVEDDGFRARFAKAPAEALRDVGIDIPDDVVLPSIDGDELDRRVEQLKATVGRDELDKLVSHQDVDESLRVQADDLLNFSRRVRPGFREKIDPATVYTISAFGTLDW
jgi:CheY-like chemotaxis protein